MFDYFPPTKDSIHKALYADVDDKVCLNTEQVISITLHNLYACIKMQIGDNLPEGKHDANECLVSETRTCPKDNVASERIFAGLDYLKRKEPKHNHSYHAQHFVMELK